MEWVAVRESGRRHGRSLGAWRAPSAVRRIGACCPCGVRRAPLLCLLSHASAPPLSPAAARGRVALQRPKHAGLRCDVPHRCDVMRRGAAVASYLSAFVQSAPLFPFSSSSTCASIACAGRATSAVAAGKGRLVQARRS